VPSVERDIRGRRRARIGWKREKAAPVPHIPPVLIRAVTTNSQQNLFIQGCVTTCIQTDRHGEINIRTYIVPQRAKRSFKLK